MSENSGGGGGWGVLGVIVGALLVAVVGFFVLSSTGMLGGQSKDVNVNLSTKP